MSSQHYVYHPENMTDSNSSTINYNFLTRFETVSLIFNTSISPSTLAQVVTESLNDKIYRSIIYDGICEYYENTKDFSFIQNIHDKLTVKQKCCNTKTQHIITHAENNKMSDYGFFNVDDLICKTMQYFDFNSLISCR